MSVYCAVPDQCKSPWPDDKWELFITDRYGYNGYCEQSHNREFLRTQQNALSNISYVFVGMLIFFFLRYY